MAYIVHKDRMQVRRSYKAIWERKNPVLLEGEIGFEIDSNKIKIGNGINGWNKLVYLISGVSGVAGNTIDDYRAIFEEDNYIYSGYNLNTVPTIIKVIDNTEEVAQNVTNLTTDWDNRLTLTYI